MAKGLNTRPTGSSSPLINGTVVGCRRVDGGVTPTHGNRTGWPDTSYSDFNEISLVGDNQISSNPGFGIIMNEGKKRYKTFECGIDSGLYPDSNMISGFDFVYKMSTVSTNTYHNNWIERYGVVFENGNFWAANPLQKDSKGETGTEHTVSGAVNNSDFRDALRGTAIKYIRFNISTEGGAYKERTSTYIRFFRFIFQQGVSSSHKIVLPPNRPYSERNSRTKLTR